MFFKQLNDLIREWRNTEPRLHVLDMNNYINSEDDFLDNINHFKRQVYYKAAVDANTLIEKVTGKRLKERSFIIKITDGLGRVVRRVVNPRSKLYLFMRKCYHKIRGGRPE